MPVSGLAVAYSTLGGLLLWSGVKGDPMQAVIKSVLRGQAPSGNSQPIGTPSLGITKGSASTGSTSSTPATSSSLTQTALKYEGNRYVWGGAPGTTVGVDAGTDCSGFVNMCLGRDLGQAIPGYGAGQYNGSTHGPTTLSYLAWSGATTVNGGANTAQSGDLLCWQTHIGIALGNGQMISALDTNDGVKVTSIPDGSPTGEVLVVRRVNG